MMKLKTCFVVFTVAIINVIISCNSQPKTDTNTDTTTSAPIQNDSSATALSDNSNSKEDIDFRSPASVEICTVSGNLKNLFDKITQHDAGTKKTTFIGFEFTSNQQPLIYTGELFDVKSADMNENVEPYFRLSLACRNRSTTIVTSTGTHPLFKRRLILDIDSFKKLVSDHIHDADFSNCKISVTPDPRPRRDSYGDYISASLSVIDKNETESARTTLHPCPKCTGEKLIDFLK